MRHSFRKLSATFALLTASLVVSSGVFSGCAATSGPANTQTDGSMIATVNGQSWSSLVVPLVTGGTVGLYNKASGTLTVTGTSASINGSTQTISLTAISPAVATFSLGLGNTGTFSNGMPGQDSYVTAGPNAGTLTISKYDTINHLVSGTFHFTAVQASNPVNSTPVTVTNGSFVNVSYTVQ